MARAIKTLVDFRKQYDKAVVVPEKFRAGIKTLTPKGWEYEAQFLQMCKISTPDGARFRNQFADFIVETTGHNSKRVYCGSKALAKKMREAL